MEELHQSYSAKGGNIVEQKKDIIQKKASLKMDLDIEENRELEIASNELPLCLVSDLIKNIKLKAVDEHTEIVMKEAIQQVDILLEDFLSFYKGDSKASEDFVEYIRKETNNYQEEIIYELSDHALFQINSLNETKIENCRDELKNILNKKESLKTQIDELDNYLSLDINEKELKEIYLKMIKTEKKILNDKMTITELEKKQGECKLKYDKTDIELHKNIEAVLANSELKDNVERKVKYSNIALKIIEKYQVALQARKADILSKTITKCYKKLANKKNMIDKIVMDACTLNAIYLDDKGRMVPKDSLSAGEQQLMVISILWALAICSKKKLPVIIDTPLSRLDSLHRTALITTYFPNAGEQTIILSPDSEINKEYYKLMKDDIGDEFTLFYDDLSKRTHIKRGYLIGESI